MVVSIFKTNFRCQYHDTCCATTSVWHLLCSTRYGTVYYHSPVNATILHHDSKTRTKEVACCLCVSTAHLSYTTTSPQLIDVANIRSSRSTTRPASLITSTFLLQLIANTFDWLKQRPCSYGCVLPVYAVCSNKQLDNLSRLPIDASESGMCVSACCCTASVVHPHDPMTKGRGGCRECQSPVHCGTPLPDVYTFRGTGRYRISQLYRYVCTVRTDRRRAFHVPTSNPVYCCFLSPGARYIERFLATPFLIVLLILNAISYGSFLIVSKM